MKIFKLEWWDRSIISMISIISIILIVVHVIFEKSIGKLMCFSKVYFCPDLDQLYFILMFLYIPALCIFSVVFIRNNVKFENWKKFTFIYFLVYLIVVITVPWYSGDGFMNIQKGDVAILLSAIYFLISIFFISKNKQ